MCTPGRPLPVFVEETFSARKRTPFRAHYTPRSPAKSCPPVSRIRRCGESSLLLGGGGGGGGGESQPRVVSFKSERKASGVASPHYRPTSSGSYFDQCFEVIEKIGEGSFGEVFKVRSRDNGRLYAVKRCWERFRGSRDRQNKLEEVERHESLTHHPNCVEFVNAWEERGLLYIQTELCQMSLAQFADLNGRVPEARVWEILADLLQGLDHLHSHQLGHFDIKPSNIFLATNGSCKLGDFGLCVSLNQLDNAMEGDAKYMARELMHRQFSKAADIFSVGMTVLELACDLELPSGGDNWHRLRDGALPHDFTRDLSPQLKGLLSRMLHPDPARRPCARELLQTTGLRWALWRTATWRLTHRVVSLLQWVYQPVVLLLLHLLSWWRGGQGADTPPPPSLPLPLPLLPPFIGAADDSFSDEEELMVKCFLSTSASEDSRSQTIHNCSYVSTSPVRYPGSFYSGPPIPLNLDEGDSPPPPPATSPCKTAAAPSEPSSENSSFSYTPNSKPLLDEQVGLRSANRSLSVGPKNLLEMFGDVGD